MMHTFSRKELYFSAEDAYIVDDCRNIRDELLLFDGEGVIVASRVSDAALRNRKNFFSLLSASERSRFRAYPSSAFKTPLLLQTSRGAALIFCHLFASSGLFAAILFHEAPSAVRSVLESGYFGNISLSDGISHGECEGSGKSAEIMETADIAMSALCFLGEETPEALARRACAVARLVGCHLSCRVSAFSELSDLFVFRVSAYVAALLYVFAVVRDVAEDRAAELALYERDGRIFIDISAKCETEAFLFLRELCEKKEFPFVISRESGVQKVSFSPEICDISLLGLKNRFIFE